MVSIWGVAERLACASSWLLKGADHAQDCGLRVCLVGRRDASAGWRGRRYGGRLRPWRVDMAVLARRHRRALLSGHEPERRAAVGAQDLADPRRRVWTDGGGRPIWRCDECDA